ncbi:DUF2231 domain-containing protein [Streptomyces albidoflavus]|uniref:DUF2231 domain-containing protein n=1 Tax=Streptomyces albidoflavus TaxID=1886 RepID=UPI00210903F7|nr:DUF2231 domain-containing protein [Streptomyces albidoflavus]
MTLGPTLINGIPAHPLLAHAVVVLVPLAALCLVACAAWPSVLRRFGVVLPLMALVVLVLVPLTTNAGEWLEERVRESSLLEEHAELGEGMLPWAVGLLAASVLVWLLHRKPPHPVPQRDGKDVTARTRTWPRWVALFLSVVVAAGAVVQVYRIGDSGARSVWRGAFSATAH